MGKVDEEGYYKPILVESAFKGNYKTYESRGNKDKNLSVRQYLYMNIPYLSHMVNDHKTGEWIVSSKGAGVTRTIYVWSDNKEVRSGNETDDVINELFKSFWNNYQKEEANNERRKWFCVLNVLIIIFIKLL